MNETKRCFGCNRKVSEQQWFCSTKCGEIERQRHEQFEAKRRER